MNSTYLSTGLALRTSKFQDAIQSDPPLRHNGSWFHLHRHGDLRCQLLYSVRQSEHLRVCLNPCFVPLSKPIYLFQSYNDHANTPSLTFQTGGDIIVEENGQPSIGEVNIYSPSCNLWGSKVLYSSNPTSILAWGLSFKNPVLFIPVYVPGVGYGQPKFEYEGDEYGPGDCDCVLNATDGSHECLCRFACIPFLIDSVAMVDPKMG